MNFFEDYFNDENKVRISIPVEYYKIIERDRRDFSSVYDKTIGGFINIIFKNFIEQAEISLINLRYEVKEYKKMIENKTATEKINDLENKINFAEEYYSYVKVINLIYKYKQLLEPQKNKKIKIKKETKLVVISKEVREKMEGFKELQDYITKIPNKENITIAEYFSIILIEYALKNYFDREKIILANEVENFLELAKKKRNKIIQFVDKENKNNLPDYYIPYSVNADYKLKFNFISIPAQILNGEKNENINYTLSLFPVPATEYVKAEKIKISCDKKEIEKYLIQYKNQKSIDKKENYIIFNEKAEEIYKNNFIDRPEGEIIGKTSDGKNRWKFVCSDDEIINYFFQFGENVYIENDMIVRKITQKCKLTIENYDEDMI